MTDGPHRSGRGVTRGLAEMLLIVVSILLAFALDSWWDGRSEAVAQRELTRLLHVDFTDVRTQLRERIVDGEVRVATGDALMTALVDPALVGADSLMGLFPAIFAPVPRVAAPASYRAAMSSGAIAVIDDPRLHQALSSVDQAEIWIDTYSRLSADLHYLGALADVERMIGSVAVLMGAPAPDRFVPDDYITLVSRPEIYSAARLSTQAARNLLGSLRRMDEAMTSVIEALEASGLLER